MPDSGPCFQESVIYATLEEILLKMGFPRIMTCQIFTSSRCWTQSIDAFYRIKNY